MRTSIRPNDPSIFDYQNRLELLATRDKSALDRLNEIMEWTIFRADLKKPFEKEAKAPGGRPAYDMLLMFKILVLQRLFNLSEEQTEFQILDRFSFQRFLGLTVADRVPDKNTIWLFKETLIQGDVFERLFARMWKYLETRGIRLGEGKIVDSSFIEVPRNRNSPDDNASLKQGEIPKDWDEEKLSHKDVDARWTKKGDENHYGYKAHIKADAKTKLVEAVVVTPASTHDSQMVDDLIDQNDGIWYGDGAYHNQAIHEQLSEAGVTDRTCEVGRRNRPLNERQRQRNRSRSRIRSRVEHIFGIMTVSMDAFEQRCHGLVRNAATSIFSFTIYNMLRLSLLKPKRVAGT